MAKTLFEKLIEDSFGNKNRVGAERVNDTKNAMKNQELGYMDELNNQDLDRTQRESLEALNRGAREDVTMSTFNTLYSAESPNANSDYLYRQFDGQLNRNSETDYKQIILIGGIGLFVLALVIALIFAFKK